MKKKGFTIIELILSLLLISLLFSIIYKTSETYDNFNIYLKNELENSKEIPVDKIYIYTGKKITKYEYNSFNF